jgi:hypothetical protein
MENVLQDAHSGCYLAIPDSTQAYPEWVLGSEEFEADGSDIPDISIDPEDGTLSVINVSDTPRTYFVTVENCEHIFDVADNDLLGFSPRGYITFVTLVLPARIVDLVHLVPKGDPKRFSSNLASIVISSDVQEYIPTLSPLSPPRDRFHLPILPLSTPVICTQSAGGHLTHFAHPGTYYAVDFRCPVGIPVIAVFDGRVTQIRNSTTDSGVHVQNLFAWNSIMIESEDGKWFVEYVHVQKDSFLVNEGDTVVAGQTICLSGDSGFCPEPHLHFEVHQSRADDSVSVPILYRGEEFRVGRLYS